MKRLLAGLGQEKKKGGVEDRRGEESERGYVVRETPTTFSRQIEQSPGQCQYHWCSYSAAD